jgi:hypothetical protein
MLRTHPVVASLILVPLAVLAAPTERRHAKHHGDSVEHIHGLAVKAHGTLLTLAFSFLYPVGVALIRGGFQRGFLLHWATQAGATTASLGGMIIMIVKSWERLIVSFTRSESRRSSVGMRSNKYHFVLYRQLLTALRRQERQASTTTLELRSFSPSVRKYY